MRLGRSLWLLAAGTAAAVVIAVVLTSGPTAGALPSPGTLNGVNVLLITVDTLRADRLGSYGAPRPTPTFDALAERGVRFTRSYAHTVMTLPSHASLLTGLLPPRHGVRNNGAFRLHDDVDTVAERLRDAGYRTAAFVAAFVLDRRFGLAQGFDTYDDRIADRVHATDFRIPERSANEVLGAAGAWITAASTPWFTWVHLFDPHTPYRPDTPSTGNAYTDEVLRVDRETGTFLRRLETAGRLQNTLIIVTADHGEALGDHGEATHGLFAYEATVRVPLIVAGPRISAGIIDAPIPQVDVAATLLSLVGARESGLDGRPRNGAAADDAPRPIYFEAMDANLTRDWAPLAGIIAWPWKYVDLPVPELYDLAADPAEGKNLAAALPQRVRELERLVAQWRTTSGLSTPAALDSEAARRLRALGYASGGATSIGTRRYTEMDDPKTLLPLHRQFMASLERAEAGDAAEAVAGLRAVIAARPTFAGAYTAAASVLMSAGQTDQAITILNDAKTHGVESAEIDRRLAAALLARGDVADVIRLVRPHTTGPSPDVESLNLLGLALAESGRVDDARHTLERATEASPASAGIWTNLGLIEMRADNAPGGAKAFRRAVEIDPAAVDAWRGLGAAAIAAGDSAAAIDAWTRAAAIEPNDPTTLFNLGVVLAEASPAAAIPYLDRFLSLPGIAAVDRQRIAAIRAKIGDRRETPNVPKDVRR